MPDGAHTRDFAEFMGKDGEPENMNGKGYLPVKLPSAFTLFCAISVRTEGTFGRLRYLLGGDRPSQTARQTLSPIGITYLG